VPGNYFKDRKVVFGGPGWTVGREVLGRRRFMTAGSRGWGKKQKSRGFKLGQTSGDKSSTFPKNQ